MAKMHVPPHHDPRAQPLLGRAAVVTGASRGIGRAIALELSSAGADVLVHAGQNRSGAEETAARIEADGRAAFVVLADLSSPQGCQDLCQQALAWRDVEIWINNAGVDTLTGEAAELSFEEKLSQLWQVDVLATIRLARRIGQHLQQRTGKGTILNVGWDRAATGMGGESGEMFAATKGAVMAFTRSLAKSLAPNVRVNCLAPGWIRTAWGESASEYWQSRAKSESLLQRWGTPEEVAKVARFLVSDDAAFINGQIVAVNGGLA